MIRIRKGLDLSLKGAPDQTIVDDRSVSHVALVGPDYTGMRPYMMVVEGDRVKKGQTLFSDKKNPLIQFTAPGSGEVVAIHRGEKRALLSVVIQLDGDEEIVFNAFTPDRIENLDRETTKTQLLESGLWTSILSRPFGHVADPGTLPHAIFVTAMDTNPLSPDVAITLRGREDDFRTGLSVLSKLTDGKVYLCKSPGADIPTAEIASLSVEEFAGPHPAGHAGTHIHFLDPAGRNRTVWHVNAQDVAAMGALFLTGKLDVTRVIALAGPGVVNPRLIKTRIGASVDDLTEGGLKAGALRKISGSVLSGRKAESPTAFLGRFHQQVSVIREFTDLGFFGWTNPGLNLFSAKNILLSRLIPNKKLDLTTAQNGGKRAIVPIGSYEKVMPLDILPTYLLRALAVNDVDEAEKLGCLELVEEDLSLCTLVCPSKIDHGDHLRRNLNIIEKEG